MEDAVMEGLDGEPVLSLGMVEPCSQQLDGLVDWDSLLIENNRDDEGTPAIIDDEGMYALLGLRAEDEAADKAREAARRACSEQNGVRMEVDTSGAAMEVDTSGAAIDVDDNIPGEMTVVHDPNRPSMALGTVYPNMKEFRLAMIQYAINEEFELHRAKSDKSRSIFDCKALDCPWHLVGRTQPDGNTVMVTKVIGKELQSATCGFM